VVNSRGNVFIFSLQQRKIKIKYMLYYIAVILLILWLLGFFAFHVGGNFIHALLVIAVIVIVIRLLQGRRL